MFKIGEIVILADSNRTPFGLYQARRYKVVKITYDTEDDISYMNIVEEGTGRKLTDIDMDFFTRACPLNNAQRMQRRMEELNV